MSIEKDIERIAFALETIAAKMGTGVPAAAPVVDPLAEDEKVFVLPATAEELRALAQKIAKNAGDAKMAAFLAYVKDKLCPAYKVDKLVTIAGADIQKASKDLLNYAHQNQIEC